MNVPRGTIRKDVWRLPLADYERTALAWGDLAALRLPVVAENSSVHPGSFEGLDLESGRARRLSVSVELRARCVFASGATRSVTVLPRFSVGDLFWIPQGTGKRADSVWTLKLEALDVARLQDLGDADAERCGAGHVPVRWRFQRQYQSSHRAAFARAWNFKWHGTLAARLRWVSNPWVWVLKFDAYDTQVDRVLEQIARERRS